MKSQRETVHSKLCTYKTSWVGMGLYPYKSQGDIHKGDPKCSGIWSLSVLYTLYRKSAKGCDARTHGGADMLPVHSCRRLQSNASEKLGNRNLGVPLRPVPQHTGSLF
jgi:hypothetical protein